MLVTCPRCGTPVQPGGSVCERCELPLEGPTRVRYNPAGLPVPSPVQGHATVMAGIIVAVILLFVGGWLFLRGVGPFRAEVLRTSELPGGGGVAVEVQVHNDGSKSGQARCRLTGTAPDGLLKATDVQLTPTIPPHGSVPYRLELLGVHPGGDVEASCS
jgi:hypothetical protein